LTGGLIGGIAYDACIFKGGESPINYSGTLWKKKAMHTEAGFFANVMHDTAKAQDIDRQLEEGDLRTTESGTALDAGSPSTLYEQDEQHQHQNDNSLAG
jgi:hypothetical protein